MGGFSLWHWLIVGIVILLLFGKGRFSSMMGDVAQGLKSFKKGMEDEDEKPPVQRSIARDGSHDAAPHAGSHGGTVVDVTPPATPVRDADEVGRP